VAIVPELLGDDAFECRAVVRSPIVRTGDAAVDSRLVGVEPKVRVADAGVTPDPGPQRPWVARSCITLTAPSRHQSSVAEASFHADPDFAFREWPIEVAVDGSRSILYGGPRSAGDYAAWVIHAFIPGTPGTDACASICHRVCSKTAARCSAMLLDAPDALSISTWQ
jgi:hypothetical protein